jgi:hypothetical protein
MILEEIDNVQKLSDIHHLVVMTLKERSGTVTFIYLSLGDFGIK